MIHAALILFATFAQAQTTVTSPPPGSPSTVTVYDNRPLVPMTTITVTSTGTGTSTSTITDRRGTRVIRPSQLAPPQGTQPTAIPPTQPTAIPPTQPTAIPPSQLSNPLPGSRTNTLPGSGPANNPSPAPTSGP